MLIVKILFIVFWFICCFCVLFLLGIKLKASSILNGSFTTKLHPQLIISFDILLRDKVNMPIKIIRYSWMQWCLPVARDFERLMQEHLLSPQAYGQPGQHSMTQPEKKYRIPFIVKHTAISKRSMRCNSWSKDRTCHHKRPLFPPILCLNGT